MEEEETAIAREYLDRNAELIGRAYGKETALGLLVKRILQNYSKFSKRTLKEQNLAISEAANFAIGIIQSSLKGMDVIIADSDDSEVALTARMNQIFSGVSYIIATISGREAYMGGPKFSE